MEVLVDPKNVGRYRNWKKKLAKHPPSVGFSSPSGGVLPSAPPLGRLGHPSGKPPPSAVVKEKIKFGVPYSERRNPPPSVAIKNLDLLQRPKWF